MTQEDSNLDVHKRFTDRVSFTGDEEGRERTGWTISTPVLSVSRVTSSHVETSCPSDPDAGLDGEWSRHWNPFPK